MKRFHVHVHVSVEDLASSIRFYSQRDAVMGIRHLGIQVEDQEELSEVYGRLKRAEGPVLEEGATTCCYARSEKNWITDPQGIDWETFLTTGESTVYGSDRVSTTAAKPCCVPTRTA